MTAPRPAGDARPIAIVSAEALRQRIHGAVNDPHLRSSFRGAMDFLMAKRAAQFPDADELASLRSLSESIRQYSLSRLPELLEQLEARLTANGVHVHWAETPDEANAILLDIARRHAAQLIVKGKSMVSEEIEFNHAMHAAGIDALESDMGEYIVQLAGEKPSHIIMPAIHQTKQQIARLFADKIPGVDYTDNVDALIQIGRRVLREKFETADIGLSGVNFAVAETGTLCLVDSVPRSFDADEQALLKDLAAMVEQELAAVKLATIDDLTGISNRRGFESLARHAMATSKRTGRPACMLGFDLNHFKRINDDFGHAAGDLALEAEPPHQFLARRIERRRQFRVAGVTQAEGDALA